MSSRSSKPRVPSYRRHKPSGQAVVNGTDVYLGKWGTKASHAEYERLIGEWLAGGRRLPSSESSVTVAELASTVALIRPFSSSIEAGVCSVNTRMAFAAIVPSAMKVTVPGRPTA